MSALQGKKVLITGAANGIGKATALAFMQAGARVIGLDISDGGGSVSITLKSGKYAGKTIGSLKAAGDNKYAGSITDPANDKTYSGKATLSGTSLKMSGCVLGGLICKSQIWHKL